MSARLLLIGPAFYGLWQGFELAFRSIGYDARSHLYDDYSSLGAKVRNKLRYELPQRLGRDVENAVRGELTRSALEAVSTHDPDVVVVIKGDVLGDELWDALDARGRPTLLWLYDALTAMSYDRERLIRPGAVVSFSRDDVATLRDWGIPADHAHLGFDSLLELPVLPARDEIVFAGARYPARERLLLDLVAHGLPVRAFGRQWSHHPWDRLRTWDVRRPAVPAGRDLDRATASARMRRRTCLGQRARQAGRLQPPGVRGVRGRRRPARRPRRRRRALRARQGDRRLPLGRGAGRPLRTRRPRPRVGATAPRRRCPAHGRGAHAGPPGTVPGVPLVTGLAHPEDLAAWQRWQDRQHPLRSVKARLRPAGDATGVITSGGPDPSVLVAIDSTSPSNLAALLAPVAHLDPARVAVLSPGDVRSLLPQGPWTTRDWSAGDPLPEVGAVVSAGHYLALGAASYQLARARDLPFVVSQHGALTPVAPPLPRGAVLCAWSEEDAEFWRSGRIDVTGHVVGSELLWQAGRAGHAAEDRPGSGTDVPRPAPRRRAPRRDLAAAARDFCRTTGATYRPHPSERDRASRRIHAAWERAGIRVDRSGTPLAAVTTPVVGVFSTGVLEAAARGIPAWVDFPRPPDWLADFWARYRMAQWGGPPTPAPRARPSRPPPVPSPP